MRYNRDQEILGDPEAVPAPDDTVYFIEQHSKRIGRIGVCSLTAR